MIAQIFSVSCLFHRFPFESNNPIGFLIAFIIEYIILGYEYFVVACILALGTGAFLFAISTTKDFQRSTPVINTKTKRKGNQLNELNTFFSEFIYSLGAVKQLSLHFNYQSSFFVTLFHQENHSFNHLPP